ncbi:MAG: alpha/beta fold hydrolase [Nocardioidaceae bacterium]
MVEHVSIDTTVGRLAVDLHGRGAPVVLWPSLFADERSWQRVVPLLAVDRRLAVITGPGHGRSGDPGHPYRQADCARAAAQVLDHLGVSGPVDWVGNAWGGHVGVRFATTYPDRVTSLVTIGSPIQPLNNAERRRTRALVFAYRLLGPARFIVDGVVTTMLSPTTRATDPEAVSILRSTVIGANRTRLRNAVVSISLHREDLAPLLPEIAAPTLMITGEQHAGWTPAQAAAAVTALRDGRVEVVPDAAYLVPLERPREVAELVRAFWAQTRTDKSASTP